MKKVLTLILVLLIVAVLLAGAAMILGSTITNGTTNIPNVYVGELNVGGLTKSETRQLLIEQGWQDRAETPLVVTTFADQSFEIDPIRSGMVTTVDSAVDAAFRVGHDRDLFSNLLTAARTFIQPVDVNAVERAADDAYLDACIDECMDRLAASLGEEEYVVDAHAGEMTLIKGWNQLTMDTADMRAAIIAALERGDRELNYRKLARELTAPDFDAIHTELEREPADAYYTDDGTFNVVDEIVGCRFDVSEAKLLWQKAEPAETVTIPLEIKWPAVTGEQLRGQLYHDLLGACMTKFPNSGENRRSNLKLCASKLDGHIIYPGEVFSYNETVGERTEAAGFLPAPAYVDGDVKDEIGGGACQISSTLYASTLFAFLEPVERSCHVFPVNYMQAGTDATVTIPQEGKTIDFKFRNNKNYPVMIKTFFNNEESTINIEIWGTLEKSDYMPIEFDNTYSWIYDYDRLIEPAYPDRPGYTIKLYVEYLGGFEDEFSSGYRTLTHRHVIDSEGNIVLDEIVNLKLESGNYGLDTYYQHP